MGILKLAYPASQRFNTAKSQLRFTTKAEFNSRAGILLWLRFGGFSDSGFVTEVAVKKRCTHSRLIWRRLRQVPRLLSVS